MGDFISGRGFKNLLYFLISERGFYIFLKIIHF